MLSRSWAFLRYLSWYSQKTRKEFEQFGLQKKTCSGKIYSRTRTFGARVHKSNIRVERWHNKYETLNYMEKTWIFFKQFAYIKSNCTALQSLTYKEEERTFGIHCVSVSPVWIVSHIFVLIFHQTRVLVTHNISFLPQVDRIIVLKGGTISEVQILPLNLIYYLINHCRVMFAFR